MHNSKRGPGLFWSLALMAAGFVLAHLAIRGVEASGVLSLPATVVQTNQSNTYTTGTQDFSAVPIKQPTYTIGGTLPAAGAASGATVQITNGSAANDCTVGGGSSLVWCRSNGAAWVAVGGASAGSGTVNAAAAHQTALYSAAGTAVSGAGPGAAGQVWTSNGAGADPTFQAAAGATLNGFYATTDNTNYFGPIYALTRPSAVTFAWRNQGGATETATGNGALYLVAPTGTQNMRIREINAPATPYTIDQAYLLQTQNVNFNSCGPVFVDSVGGKLVSFIATNGGPGLAIQVNYMTNVTTFSSTPVSAVGILGGGPLWLKVTDDGVNLIFRWSSNGQNYTQFASLARHAFLAAGPDKVGYHCDANNATYPATATLIHWLQS